jgi:hypothetical protein
MLGVLDHVRRQVDAGRLVPLGGKQAGEEAGTRADVQDPERPPRKNSASQRARFSLSNSRSLCASKASAR